MWKKASLETVALVWINDDGSSEEGKASGLVDLFGIVKVTDGWGGVGEREDLRITSSLLSLYLGRM